MISLPRIRSGLLRHPLDQQVLVYDPGTEQVHLLDPTTACVLELLEEGEWSREKIPSEITRRLGVAPDAGYFALALDELRKAGLLDEANRPDPLVDVTRRDLVKRLALTGAAALLVPAVTTLTATRGYAQGSPVLLANGQACPGGNSTCASNLCCNGFCADTCNVGVGGACPTGAFQCTTGFCCNNICAANACASRVACDSCQTDGECTDGNCNVNSLCGNGNGQANGTPCSGNGNCCSGNCDGPVQNKVCVAA